ncbi:hypothetical protein AB0I53_06855 [Saccharopolyspora sp. NPDC050389]|uniref:hypothetical protein n=1 Tax=Saccharopolyspora sp. NPDC050389 TaxID=3155516 RepID=UPI0033C025AB
MPADAGHLIGLAWHHVLHARTSIERGAAWRAEHWIGGVRDQVLVLAASGSAFPLRTQRTRMVCLLSSSDRFVKRS